MIPWILIAVSILLIVLLLIAFIYKRGERKEVDYYAIFTLGIIFTPVGIAVKNPGMWALGLVFMIIGLVNRDKWKQKKWSELSEKQKKDKTIAIIVLGILALVGVVAFFFVS